MDRLRDVGGTEESCRVHIDAVDLDAEVQSWVATRVGNTRQSEPLSLLNRVTYMHGGL
jgi:hypothetical protein